MGTPTVLPRIVVCGAVDDGKSTLIGRLLAETGSIPHDELSSAQDDTGQIDYSRLTDGLESEREQGITIDVAYRYLRLPGDRKVLLADSPGHEQYTSNMAVAASTATSALVVVDAIRGIRQQTLRHIAVCRLMGINSFVIALNKIDAFDTESTVDERVRVLQEELSSRISESSVFSDSKLEITYLPVSGLRGDNVTHMSEITTAEDVTFEGTLLTALADSIDTSLGHDTSDGSLRVPIQYISRMGERRFSNGLLTQGHLRRGQEIAIWPSGETAHIQTLYVNGVEHDEAHTGVAVAFELSREVDLGRGDIVIAPAELNNTPTSRAHLAHLVWLDNTELNTHTSYLLRVGPFEIPIRVQHVRFGLDLDSGEELPTTTLRRNDIGRVELTADRPFFLDSYLQSRSTGGFILCERISGKTVAAGMNIHPLRRESEVTRHNFSITRQLREQVNGVRAGVLWLTGLPGSGKSSIADEVEKMLYEKGIRCYILDGDMVRQTLCEDLGFSPEDRTENVRRVSRTAQLMMDAGLIVLVSLVSPFAQDRKAARDIFAHTDFVEVYVDTPLSVCQQRDPKGLYAKSVSSTANQMTGVGQQYEVPEDAEIVLDGTLPVTHSAEEIMRWIMSRRLS